MTSSEPALLASKSSILPITSLRQFAWTLGVPKEHLAHLAEYAFSHYKPRFDTEGDKVRLLDRPSERLKHVQRLIKAKILDQIELPPYVIGGVGGRQPTEHPEAHLRKRVVATIDVRDCYRSISSHRVFDIWRGRLGCSEEVARLATKLTTFQGRLPIGAPTSTLLAILRILPAVECIVKIAESKGLTVRLYIDDLAISGDEISNETITAIIREFTREGIRVNREKVKVMRAGHSQRVTKKVVNRRLAMSLDDRNKVRAALHELVRTDPKNPLYPERYYSVLGRIQNWMRFHPGRAARHREALAQLPKPAARTKSC